MGDIYDNNELSWEASAREESSHKNRLRKKLDILRDANPKTDSDKIKRLEDIVEIMLRLGTF